MWGEIMKKWDELDELNFECFLKELTNLTKRYKIAINGCGCCGSPWLYNIETGETIRDDLTWDDDKEEYYFDNV